MPFGLGIAEVLLILAVLLLVFGARRLPEIGGALGRSIREFKTSVRDIEGEMKRNAAEPPREIQRPAAPPPPLNAEPTNTASQTIAREETRQS